MRPRLEGYQPAGPGAEQPGPGKYNSSAAFGQQVHSARNSAASYGFGTSERHRPELHPKKTAYIGKDYERQNWGASPDIACARPAHAYSLVVSADNAPALAQESTPRDRPSTIQSTLSDRPGRRSTRHRHPSLLAASPDSLTEVPHLSSARGTRLWFTGQTQFVLGLSGAGYCGVLRVRAPPGAPARPLTSAIHPILTNAPMHDGAGQGFDDGPVCLRPVHERPCALLEPRDLSLLSLCTNHRSCSRSFGGKIEPRYVRMRNGHDKAFKGQCVSAACEVSCIAF